MRIILQITFVEHFFSQLSSQKLPGNVDVDSRVIEGVQAKKGHQ